MSPAESWGAHFLDALDADGKVRPRRLRDVALALTDYAVARGQGRDVGDPVFEEITEGRQSQNEARRRAGSSELPYSCCTDLAHWMLARLGCTDQGLVNRTDDGGAPWQIGVAVARITGSRWYVKAKGADEPEPGDVLFLRNASGGHICVLREWAPGQGRVVTDDYGAPYAKRTSRKLTRNSLGWSLDRSPLDGWLPLDAVPFDGPASLPDAVLEAL